MSHEEVRIGVYICHCGKNIAGAVDVKEVRKFASQLPGVVIARDYMFMCSSAGQELIAQDIKRYKLNRVVVAACSPRMHEPTFMAVLQKAGLNPFLLEMVNIREQCSWPHWDEPEKATEKAKILIKMAVERAKKLEPIQIKKTKVIKTVLVIGGGIAGITAALECAKLGLKVYLVEKKPTIGGKMALFDKTFPTMDCSACILTPKMVEIMRNPNIELITNAEVVDVDGVPGNFRVKIIKHARYVDEKKCIGCGACTRVCPVEVPNEYDLKLGKRKAIYIPFPYAVPKVAVIDPNACLRFKGEDCDKCAKICPAKAVDFNMKDEEIEVNVGAIIVAIGAELFEPYDVWEYKYGVYKDVITNLQFERLSNAAGPTGGKIVRPSDGKEPKRIAFIQCVGSRDVRFRESCCVVGCMVSLKHAIIAKEKLKDCEVFIFAPEIRAPGKGYEEFFKRARELGVKIIKAFPSEVRKEGEQLVIYFYDPILDNLFKLSVDLVVLAVPLIPSKDLEKIAKILKIPRSPDGFLLEAHPKLRPVETPTPGIYICGAAHGPKDIPSTVAQAAAAASEAASMLLKGEIELNPYVAVVDEELCNGCRVCESICPYNAIEIVEKEGKLRARVIEEKCQGCGACSASCPANAIRIKHFKDEQIIPAIKAALT